AAADRSHHEMTDYRFESSAILHYGAFHKQINYRTVQRGPLFHLPVIYIERTQLNSINMEKGKLKTKLTLNIKVINDNIFPIKVKNLKFKLHLKKDPLE